MSDKCEACGEEIHWPDKASHAGKSYHLSCLRGVDPLLPEDSSSPDASTEDEPGDGLSWEWKIVASLCMFLGALAVLGGLLNSLLNVVGGAAYFAAGLAVLRVDRVQPRVAKVVGWAAAVVALLTVLSLVRGLAAGMVSVPEAALILVVLTVPVSCAHYLIRRNPQSSHPTA